MTDMKRQKLVEKLVKMRDDLAQAKTFEEQIEVLNRLPVPKHIADVLEA